jgi:hypothetical protein
MRTFASIVKNRKASSTVIRRGAYIRSQKLLEAMAERHLGSMRGIGLDRCWDALSTLGLHLRRSHLIRGQRIRHRGSRASCLGICGSHYRRKVGLRLMSNDQVSHWWALLASSQSTKVKTNLSMYQNQLIKLQVDNICQAILES